MKFAADCHMHTTFSADGNDQIPDMCRAAIEKGLDYICFTDHVDYNPVDAGYKLFDYAKYSEAVERARDQFSGKIEILKGIEFGEPHVYPKEFEEVLKLDFDSIMVGVHYIDELYVGDEALWDELTKPGVFRRYYQDVLKTVRLGGFDVIAHLDLPKRYMKETFYLNIIDEILVAIVEGGFAIEINTSPLRRGYIEACPDADLLNRYLCAGGKKITVGSDAHFAKDIAADFDYAYNLLKKHNVNTGVFIDRTFRELNVGTF